MADFVLSQEPVEDLRLPSLRLEVSAEAAWVEKSRPFLGAIQTVWPHFLHEARDTGLFEELELDSFDQTLDVELTFSDNAMIQALNRDYRFKDEPTDVLTFPLLTDSTAQRPWQRLPMLPLGNIVISLEWAEAATQQSAGPELTRYVMERFVHGMLHLLGCHHDTMHQYQKVVAIQNRVLSAALGA